MRSRLLLARILTDEQDCSRLCLRDDIDEGMVGMKIDTTRLVGGEGGHRHDGSCDRSGFCSFFADLYLGLLEHFRDEEIAVGQMAEVGSCGEDGRCAQRADDLVEWLLHLGGESGEFQIDQTWGKRTIIWNERSP